VQEHCSRSCGENDGIRGSVSFRSFFASFIFIHNVLVLALVLVDADSRGAGYGCGARDLLCSIVLYQATLTSFNLLFAVMAKIIADFIAGACCSFAPGSRCCRTFA